MRKIEKRKVSVSRMKEKEEKMKLWRLLSMHTGVVAGIVAYFSLIIEQPATYQTALGTFVTNNQGEFGGELTLPNGEIMQGNFCEIIECGNHVYAIDSCGHMGMGYFSLYSFSNNEKKNMCTVATREIYSRVL